MDTIKVEVVSPSKIEFQGEAQSITVPGSKGSFQVLHNHAPIVSSLEIGKIKMTDVNGLETYYATSGGMVEVKNNNVVVLADTFESAKDIDVARAKAALERANERISKKEGDTDIERAKLALARALNRIKIHDLFKS